MNKLFLLLTVFFIAVFAHAKFETVDENRFFDDLTVSKLRLVIERFNGDNQEFWRQFADLHEESGLDLVKSTGNSVTGAPLDGYRYFNRVLNEIEEPNEIWIAYVTTNKDLPQRKKVEEDNDDILYYMTVVTSPKALITSHMGIAKTYGGYKKDVKNVAVKLHSLAAEVMLYKNPLRRFMINAPTWVMESIIADALPDGGLYIGTREGWAEIERIGNLSLEQALESSDARTNDRSKNDRIKRTIENLYNKMVKIKGGKEIPFREFQAKHPPIISLDSLDPLAIREHPMTIYEPGSNDVVLRISRTDKEIHDRYQWMFKGPFLPSSRTHYIAVDLKKLAAFPRDTP